MSARPIDPPWHPIFGKAHLFVLRQLGVSHNDLVGRRRQAYLIQARALWVWIVMNCGPSWISHPIAGHWLGERDHSTILHMNNAIIPRLLERDEDFRRLCALFEGCDIRAGQPKAHITANRVTECIRVTARFSAINGNGHLIWNRGFQWHDNSCPGNCLAAFW